MRALKVAVVIPIHNHARFVGAALESLRVQTRPPDRVILIDDGSTDGSTRAVVAYAESVPVKPAEPSSPSAAGIQTRSEMLVQPHAGLLATIRRGVALADDCDCVAILQPDDCFHPQRLERCTKYLQDHPRIDLLCTRPRLIDDDGHTLPAEDPHAQWFSAAWSFHAARDEESALDLSEWLGLANFPGPVSNFFARRTYLRDHPLAETYPHAPGYHAALVAALDNRFGVIDAELLDHRIHAPGAPTPGAEAIVRETLQINLDLARQLAPRLSAEPELRRAFARYQRAAWSNVSEFRADLFNLILVEALALLPPTAADALLAQIDAGRFPEIGRYSYRASVNGHEPAPPDLGPTSGLADKFLGLKGQLSAVRAGARPWAEYRQVQSELLESKWFALGRLLGLMRPVHRLGGETVQDKLARLRERVRTSRWLRLGNRLGVRSAARLLALVAAETDEGQG